ncbi:MAG: hypothetical protein K8T91_04360 [Planctomycetes bacterium]|nr:hypothetical protein [Planctomycetota bacterium]
MVDQRLLHGFSVFSSGYVKRWMENNYDRLMMTGPGKRLMDLDQKTRYGIEAMLYAVMAVGEHNLGSNSPLKWLLKEVLLDAPPEIGKRLINGFRDDYVRHRASTSSAEKRDFGAVLEDLSAEQLNSFLIWASGLTSDEFERLRAMLPQLSKEQLIALMSLGDAERKTWLAMFHGPAESKAVKEKPARSAELQERIDAARVRVREEHQQLRERRAGK